MSMKYVVSTVAATVVLAVSAPTFANDIRYPFNVDTGSANAPPKSRAEVRAELEQAREQGLLSRSDQVNYPNVPQAASSRSRQEVREEAIRFARHHEFNPDYDIGA